MADMNNADTGNQLSINTPQKISKDMQGSDNLMPLSPQWLLPKPGENKPGMGECHLGPNPGYNSRPDIPKSPGSGEEVLDTEKKREIFRPTLHDTESGRRDRWRDDERDTNSSIRRDRWREGDRELGDTCKIDRWMDNSSIRQSGEARRAPSECWTDSSNREINYEQRRESKWNTRWGPDDKESESSREKWLDPSRGGEVPRGKGMPHLTNHGKDDREGDHFRPWRSNSSQSRGRGEPPNHQTLTPNKLTSTFSHGRGRLENASSTFALGRGKVITGGGSLNSFSSHSNSLGTVVDKGENAHGVPSPLRYSRTKLLDIYRMTDLRSYRKPSDGFVEVDSLTHAEPLEPLALCVPTLEELVILKGIDKGDVVSSGTSQTSKDGSVGRNLTDGAQLRQAKFGSKEDLPSAIDDYKDGSSDYSKVAHLNFSDNPSYEKHIHHHGFESKSEAIQNHQMYPHNKFDMEASGADGAVHNKADEVSFDREVSMQGKSSHSGSLWRFQPIGERSDETSHDSKDFPTDVRSRTSDIGWLHQQKERNSEWENSLVNPSYYRDEPKRQVGEALPTDISRDSILHRQPSAVLDREQEVRKFLGHPSPEDMSLYYKDPQGEIQGPFTGSDLIGWFESGYFGIDLQVRSASASPDTPFSSLGDVMPHLRAKARPPPGFGVPKQNDTADILSREKFSSLGKIHAGSSGIDIIKNDSRHGHESAAEAENRFLESLMAGNMSSSPLEKFSFSEGPQGYIGDNSSGMLPMGVESENNLYLLAKKISLERQRSLPNLHPYWSGIDAAPVIPSADIVPDSHTPHSKLPPSLADNPHQAPHSQNVDLLSILQGVSDKPSTGTSNRVTSWSNFPVQGGFNLRQDKDIRLGQQFSPQAAYGTPQQRLQPQSQPSLTNILAQAIDNPSGALTAEKLLASGLSQDPQVLSLLQQQYLLQLHSQAAVPTQLSLLDKLLLLKQQQKQEEQQQLLLQQQHLLSQVLSEHQSHQHFGEPSYGQMQAAAMPKGFTLADYPGLKPPLEAFQINSQIAVPNMQGVYGTNFTNLPLRVTQDVTYSVSPESSSLHLPHQIFENPSHLKSWDSNLSEQIDDTQQKDSLLLPETVDGSPPLKGMKKPFHEPSVPQNHVFVHDSCASLSIEKTPQDTSTNEPFAVLTSEPTVSFVPSDRPQLPVVMTSSKTGEDEVSMPEQVNEATVQLAALPEERQVQSHSESSVVKAVKNVEILEVKKASEKKSRKQKISKAQSSLDQAKVVSKTSTLQQSWLSELVGTNVADTRSETGEPQHSTGEPKSGTFTVETVVPQTVTSSLLRKISGDEVETFEDKDELREHESVSIQKTQMSSEHRAWRPPSGLKAKSLLEIQKEQRKTWTEMAVSEITTSINSISLSNPWAGVVTNSELRPNIDNHQNSSGAQVIMGKHENALNSKSKKSQLHDLLAEEVLMKSNERLTDVPDKVSSMHPLPVTSTQVDSVVNDDNFIEAKDMKKSRKKSAKGKGAGGKAATPVASADVSVASSPVEKGKSSRQVQPDKEMLAAPPSGPSLGDFVFWKGEAANASPAPAWSTDSGKFPKPASLRDIQKEQGKNTPVQHQSLMPSPQKVQSNRATRGSDSSWLISGSSPSKAASPIQINSLASAQSKSKGEDDLFWGPLDQSKKESKQSDFPSLANQNSWGTKNTPVKGTPAGSLSRQKSSGSRHVDYSLLSSPGAGQSSLRGKRETVANYSEAMDFRDWCERESIRLTGTKDTNFLEFCLKQSTSEAQTLLIENLGSFDPDHEFIDKFLNYKELLSANVIEMAFQAQSDLKFTGFGADVNADNVGIWDLDPDMAADPECSGKGGGKKKGKKGKKVSPAVLGFNVVSNRIMMGDIQTVEE